MKILVVGDGHSAIHEVAVVEAFKKLGHQVEAFYWYDYFNSQNSFVRLWQRVQNKFIIGPTLNRLNTDLIKVAAEFNPTLIFVYRGTHVIPETITKIKQKLSGCVVYGYNNDDPFAAGHPPWLWRHFLKSVPKYDLVLAYRHHNLDDFIKIGARRVELLRSWFLPELHKPPIGKILSYKSDCVFIGHYENDGRAGCLEELILSDVQVKLFGPYKGLKKSGWDIPISKSKLLASLLPVSYLQGHDYVQAISEAPIALCFLSKLNKDTYTRRCFEIPAIGAALFSEYSDDLASLFIDGKEAVFFKNKEELVSKVQYYLSHLDKLDEIRIHGYQRVMQDGHDIYTRLNNVINLVKLS
ncbi:MAG: glycosyltransferase [Methylococcaceae bacterium]